jgi:type I restriction enzyme S subunit
MQRLFTHGIGHSRLQKTEIGEIPTGWKVEALGRVAMVERGKFSNRPRNDPKFYGGDIPFIQTGDVVRSGGRIKNYSQTLNEDGLAISRKFPKGTIVLTIAANIGDTGILEFDSCFPDSLVGITVNDEMDNIFLEYFLRTRKVYLNSIATQSAQKNINLQKLEPMIVVKPGLKEQRQIADILTSVDEKISVNKKLKAGLTLLKKGLMQDLLSGKKRTV